jgi:hypothetical protein
VSDFALREIHHGRVWRANACRLVEELDDLLVLWCPLGIPRKLPLDRDGEEIRLPQARWRLGERLTVWEGLGLVRPRARYSLWLHWDRERAFSHWYVNFERPLGRTQLGWDYVDDKLDLVVSPDGGVRWKDEDELEAAARLGLLDSAEIRAEAERVLADPPWPTGREGWRPDPAWPAPRLPAGWDAV